MAGPPVPPAAAPRPEEPLEEERERNRNWWLIVVTIIAVAAAAAAGYAISEIEATKDDNREGNVAVQELRADVEVLREQVTERLDTVEGRLDDAADAQTQRRLQNDLDALDRRVRRLDEQSQGGASEDLEQRVDDLEQRVDDLEQESN